MSDPRRPPPRPGRAKKGPGGGQAAKIVGVMLIVTGIGVGIVVVLAGLAALDDKVAGFARLDPARVTDVILDEDGTYTIYEEGLGFDVDGRTPVGITVERIGGGEIDLDRADADVTYDSNGRNGAALFTFDVPSAGTYRFTLEGSLDAAGEQLAVGRSVAGDFLQTIVMGIVVGGGVVLIGIVVLIVGFVIDARAATRRRAANRRLSGARGGGQRAASGERAGADRAVSGTRAGADRAVSGTRAGADRAVSGARAGADRAVSGARAGGEPAASGERAGGDRPGRPGSLAERGRRARADIDRARGVLAQARTDAADARQAATDAADQARESLAEAREEVASAPRRAREIAADAADQARRASTEREADARWILESSVGEVRDIATDARTAAAAAAAGAVTGAVAGGGTRSARDELDEARGVFADARYEAQAVGERTAADIGRVATEGSAEMTDIGSAALARGRSAADETAGAVRAGVEKTARDVRSVGTRAVGDARERAGQVDELISDRDDIAAVTDAAEAAQLLARASPEEASDLLERIGELTGLGTGVSVTRPDEPAMEPSGLDFDLGEAPAADDTWSPAPPPPIPSTSIADAPTPLSPASTQGLGTREPAPDHSLSVAGLDPPGPALATAGTGPSDRKDPQGVLGGGDALTVRGLDTAGTGAGIARDAADEPAATPRYTTPAFVRPVLAAGDVDTPAGDLPDIELPSLDLDVAGLSGPTRDGDHR